MASMHSVTLDEEGCSHYYHCVLSNIEFSMPLSVVADFIVPKPSSPAVQALEQLGCRVVPHKLHSFKEKLPTKFGFVTYYIHHKAEGSRDDVAIHKLFLQWVRHELPQQLTNGVKLVLAQPATCCQAGPFLREIRKACGMIHAAKDALKVETFLLSKVNFYEQEVVGEQQAPSPDHEWEGVKVGSVLVENIPAVELAWLRTEHPEFPEKADVDSLMDFFGAQLHPHFTVSKQIVL